MPDGAVERVELEDADPSFGLNALGGALSIRLKTGFDDPGGRAQGAVSDFGWRSGDLSYGASSGGRAVYLALSDDHDGGWRRFSPSDLRRAYGALGWRGDGMHAGVSVLAADNSLSGLGVTPVQLLDVDRRAVFTRPDATHNAFLRGQASLAASRAGVDIKATAYLSRLRQSTRNGDASAAQPCDDQPALLCLSPAERLTGAGGAPIASPPAGVTAAQLNRTWADTLAFGAAMEARGSLSIGLRHRWLLGAALDGGRTGFQARTMQGVFTSDRAFQGPGVVIDQASGEIAPVDVRADDLSGGVYGADVIAITRRVDLSLSARFNLAHVRLDDRLGTALNASHDFARLNPGVRLEARPARGLVVHLAYSEANRAPTPAELSCAAASSPCSLANFFVSDPPLRQVVARTVEAGAGGDAELAAGRLEWRVSAWRTDTRDEIMFVASPIVGRDFFENVGAVRRQGLEVAADYARGPVSVNLSYALVDATFRSALVLDSPDNPFADADGRIFVPPGSRLPNTPRDRFDADVSWQASSSLSFGAHVAARGGVVLQGDEAAQTPPTAAFALLDLRANWKPTRRIEARAQVSNVFNVAYTTFGAFSPTANVPIAEAPGATNPRSLAPGAPRRASVGLAYLF
ncbi:MAG: TonB-dependent receptor [Caulobacterales bacterium]